MEIYLVKLALLFDRKLNIPLLPIKIGEVDKANTSIPIPPKTGLANDAHIITALYKKPQGNIAVKIPSVAEYDNGEYLFILFIKLLIFVEFPILFFLIKKMICITETIATIIASFLADRFKKSLNINKPNNPDKTPINKYANALLKKYCQVFFWQDITIGEHMPKQCKEPVNPYAAIDNIGTKMFKKLSIKQNSNHKETSILISQNSLSNKVSHEFNLEDICLHCKKNFTKNKDSDLFCCNGCANVYQFLISNDLSKYYEIMNKVGEKPSTAEDFSDSHFSIFKNDKLNSIFKFRSNLWGFFIPEVKCAACIWLIEKSIQNISNVSDINVNILDKIVTFSLKENDGSSLENVARSLIQIGYNPLPLPFLSSKEFRTSYEKERIKDIGISGFAFGNVMIFAASSYFGKYFGINPEINHVFIILSMIISVPATIYAGRSFFINSYNALINKKIHIDTTISFALIVSLIISIYEAYKNSGNVYFDSITGLVFLLLVGRYFHEKSIHKAKELGEAIKNILPIEAFSINKGDKINVPIGKTFLADGYIIEGETEVNEASLTGEEYPVLKKKSDYVLAGSQNLLNPVTIIAEKTGSETWVSSLENLILIAKSKKSKVETQIEKILPYFTILIVLISVISFIIWSFISIQKALDIFVSILIISCPCALALATPLLMSSALKKLWEKGVIVKNQNSIETIPLVDSILFDKTGTLTCGNLSVLSYDIINKDSEINNIDEILSCFSSLSSFSLHLVSKAISKKFNHFSYKFNFKEIKEHAGKGIEGYLINSNIHVKIGNSDFIGIDNDESELNYSVYAKYDNIYFKFILTDKIQLGADNLISFLKEKNIETYLLSGDKQASVRSIANKLGINLNYVFSSLLPKNKLEFLEKLQTNGKKVMAVGDGVNDAAMLAKAHVSIASHGGTDIALHSADIFLRKSDLNLIKSTFYYCQYVKKTLKILISVSLIYNIIAILFACLGYVDPLFAAIFMPISSLTVYLIVYFRQGKMLWE